MLKVTVTPYWIALHFVTDAKRTVKFSVRSCPFTCVSCQFLMRWMRSVSGNIRFVRSYPFACSKLRMDATGWRCSVDERFLCVSMRFVRFSCVRHPVGILYVSLDVRSSWAVEPSTSGHVTIKTDEYRMSKSGIFWWLVTGADCEENRCCLASWDLRSPAFSSVEPAHDEMHVFSRAFRHWSVRYMRTSYIHSV